MKFEKQVYEKFYWLFQSIMVESEFSDPKDAWKLTSRSKTSEKHWATVKKK